MFRGFRVLRAFFGVLRCPVEGFWDVLLRVIHTLACSLLH